MISLDGTFCLFHALGKMDIKTLARVSSTRENTLLLIRFASASDCSHNEQNTASCFHRHFDENTTRQ